MRGVWACRGASRHGRSHRRAQGLVAARQERAFSCPERCVGRRAGAVCGLVDAPYQRAGHFQPQRPGVLSRRPFEEPFP